MNEFIVRKSRASVWALCLLTLSIVFLDCAAAGEPNAAIEAALASERMPGDREQDTRRKPREVLSFLEVAPGQHVLDFFTGPGYYSELLARVVGAQGEVVLYNDELYFQAAYHELLLRLTHNRLPNAKLVKAAPNYLRLAPASLDRVLFCQVYHDLYWRPSGAADTLGKPHKVLTALFAALKSGGLVVVVDHIANETSDASPIQVASRLHRIVPRLVRADFEAAGFEFVGEDAALRNAADEHTTSVFNPAVRGRTDQFIYKFRKR